MWNKNAKRNNSFWPITNNFINGGEGRAIVEKPLQDLIHKHVVIGWNKTHFLSFSSNITTALGYGASVPGDKTLNYEFEYDEYYDNDSAYDFILLTLHTNKVEWREIGLGIYEGLHSPSIFKFSLLPDQYRVILIDVAEVLRISANNNYLDSIVNAVRDKEWLLLPATTVLLNSGKQEYSAILDAACISYKKSQSEKNMNQDNY